MTTIATKFQVTVAAAAVAAGAAFVPVAANAAPQIQLPAAPFSVDNLAEGPVYVVTAASLQLYSVFLKQSAASQDRRADRLEAYAAAHPTSFFGQLAASRAAQLRTNQAVTNGISFDICLNGQSAAVGPYGTFTKGAC
ncbi:hypothetical protein GR927_21880 [Mycolicibacterium sp. 3033]|nr:hypothetical protein [Mycolicibacterium aurantiacum]